jgi:hypothetical protein
MAFLSVGRIESKVPQSRTSMRDFTPSPRPLPTKTEKRRMVGVPSAASLGVSDICPWNKDILLRSIAEREVTMVLYDVFCAKNFRFWEQS